MIIKAARIATNSGAGAVAAHVLRGPQNEAITLLQGSEQQLRDAVRDAQAGNSKYSLRHYKISPGEAATPDDVRGIIDELGREFGFQSECVTIVWHQKPRAGGAGFDHHAHALVPEYDPVRNRVLDWHNSYPRHEKIARLAEERLGHAHVAGRHNAAVAHALTSGGKRTLAETVERLAEQPRPNSGYRTETHQRAERTGRNQPADRLAVREAWERSDSPQAFTAALAEQGIRVRAGEKQGVWIAERGGDLVGAVHRLAGADRDEVARRLDGADHRTVAEFQSSVPPPLAAPATTKQEPRTNAAHGQPPATTTAATPQFVPPRDEHPSPTSPISASGSSGATEQPAVLHDGHGGGDPTAGIEIPEVWDLLGQIRYCEKVAKRAVQIAEAAAKRRLPQPQQETGGPPDAGQTHTDDNVEKQRAAAEAVRRFLDQLSRAFARACAEAAIQAAVERFAADCAGIGRGHAAAGSADSATGRNDTGNVREDGRGTEFASRPYSATAERRTEPDNRNPELPDAPVREPATNRAAEREALARGAAARRFEREVAAQPEALQRLRQAAAALHPDPFRNLHGRERADALASARTELFATYQTQRTAAAEAERLRWKNAPTAQQTAAQQLTQTVKSGGRSASTPTKTAAFDSVRQTRQRTAEDLKQSGPERLTFEDWLQRQSLADPAAREIHKLTVEQRLRREQVASRITADRDTITRVLATHPHPNPADRDLQARANACAGRLSDEFRDRQAAADAAARAAAEATASRSTGTKLLTALGLTTPEQRRADDLQERAHEAAETAQRRRPTNDDYRHARATGEAQAQAADRAVQAWQERPDVAAALENARLNTLAQAAADAGDRNVAAALRAGEPAAARSIIRARERHEEERRRLAEEARNNGPRGPNSGPVGPRRR